MARSNLSRMRVDLPVEALTEGDLHALIDLYRDTERTGPEGGAGCLPPWVRACGSRLPAASWKLRRRVIRSATTGSARFPDRIHGDYESRPFGW